MLEIPTRVLEACVNLIEKDDDLLGHAADDDVIHLEYIPDSDECSDDDHKDDGVSAI